MGNKYLVLLILLISLSCQQILQPIMLLPTETTQNISVDYAFSFYTDTNVPHSAYIQIIFPFQFDVRILTKYKECLFASGSQILRPRPCSLNKNKFNINVETINIGNMTVLIKNIQNPIETQMSSHFNVKTYFRDVIITQNLQFGKIPFTKPPTQCSTPGKVYNYQNILVEQGSTWVFRFTLDGTYRTNSTLRFIFPQGFKSNKIQCNITGIIDSEIKTRVFPQANIFDCLNVKSPLSGYQNIILSGVVNPNYQMQMQGLKVQIIQPNNIIVQQVIEIDNQPMINAKNMNVSINIPNNFRNNTLTYIFEINLDSDLYVGDYIQMVFWGNWTFFIQDSRIIEGIISSYTNQVKIYPEYNSTLGYSRIYLRNFSSISKQSQVAFYLSLKTPLIANTYNIQIKAYRSNKKIVQTFSQPLLINATTGYIREMKLHPMNQAIKLPVGQTGPLQITLALRNNLPKTNVLTYGKIVLEITPHIPKPDININGIPKCYFYGTIPAKNCSYDVNLTASPSYTSVIAYTPVDFNFQSSQIPFMVTTQGYINEDEQGLTIDTLVKRYHFHVQFYTDYREQPIPTEVIFTDWVADPIPLTDLSCNELTYQWNQLSHLKCQFTTKNQILNSGHIHILQLQFTNTGWYTDLGYSPNQIYPDYPCLVYGTNVLANPYPKCDLITYTSGPYAAEHSRAHVNIYGLQNLVGNSLIIIQIPQVKRNYGYPYSTQLILNILQDTYGYQTQYLKLYSQTISLQNSQWRGDNNYYSENVSYTMTNNLINKLSDINLISFDLTTTGVSYIIFEVDQTMFPDIGREKDITCGTHKCSKFNKPVQYFILYPSTALARYQNLTFPSILNPSQSGNYEFKVRVYKNYQLLKKIYFDITIQPDTLAVPSYTFASFQTITQMYPNTNQFYTVSWTLKNPIPQLTGYIEIIFVNYFTLSSKYCSLNTTALPYNGREVQCQVWQGENKVILSNMKKLIAGDTFSLSIQMITITTTAFTPQVTIYTYSSSNIKVDQIINSNFTSGSIANTNLKTLSSFSVLQPYEITGKIQKQYFGDLIINYDPLPTSAVTSGYYLILTLTSQFYPYSNQLNLPLSCKINQVRFQCTYTLNPFTITINNIQNRISTANNKINITTQYLQRNGIYYPVNQGRYLLKAKVLDQNSSILETTEQYSDIRPGKINYFNVTYVHRDANLHNIFVAEFQNGLNTITAYNDASNASRIYIGFPTSKTDNSGPVFSNDLGYSNGTVIPCYFQTGSDYITPITGKKLQCRLRRSPYLGIPTYVQIINFAAITSSKKMKVFMGKIKNPSQKQIDLNFNLKIQYFNPNTRQQTPQYQNDYNLFIQMLDGSVIARTQANNTTPMFEAGAKVGDLNKYINHIPYTQASVFKQNDWFIIAMTSNLQFNGVVNNCLYNFYKRCIVFQQINWVAININNGTLIPFYPYIKELPGSISRVDTTYECYTFLSQRWAETITYTITADYRWMELRGAISGFSLQVLGSQNKLNIGQKNVDILLTFNVSHKVNKQGTIQIKFPSNSTLVPSIRSHCRSAVTMGSSLKGFNTGKPSINNQGQVGCLIQNDYSWLITSFEQLAAGSQVKIVGNIDFPSVLTSSLGTGYIVTYSNQHSTNVFANGMIIDYLSTNFLLQVENKTWSLDPEVSLTRSQPLRINHIGPFEFKFQSTSDLNANGATYPGAIYLNFWKKTILGDNGGFNGPTFNLVCIVYHQTTLQRYACQVTSQSSSTDYYTYKLVFYDSLPANNPFIITLTTQNGNSNEGINYPTSVGTYKIDIQVDYSTLDSSQVNKAHFVEVYGPNFNVLNLISTVSIPDQLNLLLFQIIPSSTMTNNVNRLVIEIPTISNEGIDLFAEDLGMRYRNYDDLVFDLYDSSISSMKCKFYSGDKVNYQPVKITCNQYSSATLTTSSYIRFGFWVKNPSVTIGIAVPIQVYFEETTTNRKLIWQILQGGIKVLPTTSSPINDFGNFQVSNTFRQLDGVDFKFTTRNTKTLVSGDLYILKFNFDLRKSNKFLNTFKYPYSSYSNSGNTIFLKNCKTILIQIGTTALANAVISSLTENVMLYGVFYNPSIKLSTSESQIIGYSYYKSTQTCQKIVHKDAFPSLVPNQPSSPTFTMTAVNGNLRKSQYQDYTFSFRMSSISSSTDTALVKKISIQFPAYTSVDFKFMSQSCIQTSQSSIQTVKCYIDTSTLTIWIEPYIKSTYQNNHYITIQTLGKALMNPQIAGSVNLNQFVIKYYTWPDGVSTPAIYSTSDDYVFMKQDSSNIGSSVLTFTQSAYSHHDSLSISQELYTNQFSPASTDLGTTRMRTPLEFKFKAMTTFTNKDKTNNYHVIKVYYDDYYQIPSIDQLTNDLKRWIPVCQLNGYRILSCSISGGYIIMNFQHGITSGEQISVRFSILDPVNNQDDGFQLKSLSYPSITLSVYITPYAASPITYYVQPQQFPTFYRVSGTYPSMGIVSATVSFGTQVVSKMNYLDFSLTFSRNDINGLILQIPLLKNDGSSVYSNATLLDLPSGSEFPCSVGKGLDVYCFYEKGETTNYGRPTRIYISRFTLQTGNTLSFRMLFTNPDIVGVFPSFIFKAFTGTIANQKLMGQQYAGQYQIDDAFKTFPTLNYYSSKTCTLQPTRHLYNQDTQMRFFINNDLNSSSYVMLQWTLHHPTYGQVSTYSVYDNSYDYDYLWINYAPNNRKLYIVKKITTNLSTSSSSYHQFGYLRNRHFILNDAVIYIFQSPYLTIYGCTVNQSWYNNYLGDDSAYGAMQISYLDMQDRSSSAWSWHFLSVDLGSTNPTNVRTSSTDLGEIVVVVKFTYNRPYNALSSTTDHCSLQDGITNTNALKPITCYVDALNNRIIFRNVNVFTGRYLKFYYYAQSPIGDISNSRVQVMVFANEDAYLQGNWWMFQDTTGNFNMDKIYFTSSNTYSVNGTSPSMITSYNQTVLNHDVNTNMWVKITSVSSTQITFQAYNGGSTINFNSDVYRMAFRFYVQRLSFSASCSVVAQPVSRTLQSCTGNGNLVTLIYQFYSSDNSHSWPSWSAGQYYTFTLNFGSISGELNADYLFVTMVYTWQVSTYHYRDSGKCGYCYCNWGDCCQNQLGGSAHCITDYNYYGYPLYDCCPGRVCKYYSCRWYYAYGGQVITGKTTPYSSTSNPVSSYTGSLLSNERGRQTQLTIQYTNFQINVGASYKSYILMAINDNPSFNGNSNPFPASTTSQNSSLIDCKCVVYSGSLSMTATLSYSSPTCVRYNPSNMQPSIGINIDVSSGQNMKCYFPGFIVPSSTTNNALNIDMFVYSVNFHKRYIPRSYWSKYSMYDQINIVLRTQVTLSWASMSENSIWTSGATLDSRSYQMNISSSNTNYPVIYISTYAPKPTTSYCDSTSLFTQCRIYDSFVNRRYYVVARSSQTTTIVRLNGTVYYPPSKDISTSFYGWMIYWTYTTGGYYTAYNSNDQQSSTNFYSLLSPTQPSKALNPPIYGSLLQTYRSSIVIAVNMNGKTLYRNSLTYGAYKGSFIKVTLSNFTSLYGCGATLKNRPRNLQNPFYCKVISTTILQIYARNDISMTDYLYITVNTDSVPNYSTYKIELYDKYVSTSDYGLSVLVSNTFSRPKTGYSIADKSFILWRKPVYRQARTTTGPIRFTLKNNYQYVSEYNQTTNSPQTSSDCIVVYLSSGFSSSDKYICFAKEYSPGKRSLYKQFQVPCGFFNYNGGNRVYIRALPSHTLKATYYYEFSIYRVVSGQTMFITIPTSDVYGIYVATSTNINSQNIVNYDYFDHYLYKSVYPCTLNHIYYLTAQAAAINSLYLSFTLNVAGTSYTYFQFQFDNLGLSSFEISNGEQIPCYLSQQFTNISTKTQKPRCYGFVNLLGSDSPLIIRVFGMQSWSTGTNFKLAFDNFNNPSSQTLFLTPINIQFRYLDRTNNRKYSSYWPSIYLTDSINLGNSTQILGSLSQSNSNRGASSTQYIAITWPYTSSSSDNSQKVVMKLQGGVTCCNSFSSIALRDNGFSYTLLWTDTIANMSVYKTPSRSSNNSVNLQITGIVNPYPYQKQTYQKLKKLQILFYSSYKTSYIKKIDQLDYTSYSQLSQFNILSSLTIADTKRSFSYHSAYPITYDFTYRSSLNSFSNRQLSYSILTFTTGVNGIDWVHNRYQGSPYYFNSLSSVTIGKNAANQYFLNISGMSDSTYSTSYDWYLRVRLFCNANTISFSSTTYALNGQIQFTNSQSYSVSSNGYKSTGYSPTYFHLRQQKYFKNYYQLKRIPIYAKSGSTVNSLKFRFKTPYNISNEQTLDFILDPSTEMIPVNTPTSLYCFIQKTLTTKLSTGISRWSECSYISENNKFQVKNPIGNLLENTQYTLTIFERNLTTSTFSMPTTPKRLQVSLIFNSQLNLKYGDVYELDFQGRMTSFTVSHATLVKGWNNLIGLTFTPGFTLPAASLTPPVTQTLLEFQISSKYHLACLNAESVFSTDGQYFASGTYFSHYTSTPGKTNSNTRLKCGQYSKSFAPIKLSTTDFGQFTAGTSYYFRFPLIVNPSGENVPFLYKIRMSQYATNSHYPVIISSYEYQGLQDTDPSSSDTAQTGQITGNSNNQNTMTLYFSWPNYNQASNTQTWIKWKVNQMQALTSIAALSSISTSNYNYQFYPNINLCVFKKSNSVDDCTVDLGSFPTSIDQRAYKISWVNLITSSTGRRYQNALQYKISDRSSWSSSSFTKVSGLQSTLSEGIFKVTFSSSALFFPQGSYMHVAFLSSPFEIMDQYCKSLTGFVQGVKYPDSNLVCKRYNSTLIIIQGYSDISLGTNLSFQIYLKSSTSSIGTYSTARPSITVYSIDDKYIIRSDITPLSYSITEYGSSTLKLENIMRYDMMKDTARQLYIMFTLSTYNLNIGQYVEVDFGDWTLDQADTAGQIIAKYKIGNNLYWVPTVFTKLTGNKYRFGIYNNASTYSVLAGTSVTLRIDQINPNLYNGLMITETQWNYLKITAHQSNSTIIEHQYAKVWIQPYEHISLNVQPALKYIDATGLYEFIVTPNVSASIGDYILIEFRTNDQLYDNLFSENLGKTISKNDSLEISCRESDSSNKKLSDDYIKCVLFKGDITVTPSIPTTVRIKIEKNISANTNLKFNILNLKNPSKDNYPIGITFKYTNKCIQSNDINNLCAYYKSTKYLYFDSLPVSFPTLNTDYGILNFSPNLVSATSSEHTLSAPISLAINDILKIVYYPQVTIPTTCSLKINNGVCYSYPLQNTIIIKALTTQTGSYSFILTGMTNLYQYKTTKIYTQVWKYSTKTISDMFQTDYFVGTIYNDPASTNPLKIQFFPTLTTNYHLSYGFGNIAKVTISYLLQNNNIKQIYLQAPSGINLITNYCNATLQTYSNEAITYPFRFKCTVISSSAIRINMQSDFPIWQSNFINRKIILYLQYTIQTFLLGSNCSNWIATSYTDSTSTLINYRVSQAVGNFYVINYMSPFIYKIDFFTLSFQKRICLTGQECMFYGYLLPSTSISDYLISYMDYTIPKQFKYSNLIDYNNCDMQQYNNDFNPITICQASRNYSTFNLRFKPTSYNHNYKLIKIDHNQVNKLFTAPEYPGSHYQMKVDLYTNTHKLIEQQYVNLTTIYGSLLNYSQIFINIPLDASVKGRYEVTFKIGAKDVQPAYQSSLSNLITSAIQIIFSNSFDSDLGTGFKAGQQIACLPIAGLRVKTTGRLTCRIYPSESSITYPTIIVKGYDKIYANQIVIIHFAGLQSLSVGVQDFIKIGVSYTYYQYGNVKGYLYEPTGKVVGLTTSQATSKNITATVTQTSSNFVGQLASYYFTCSLQSGFKTIKTTDYIGVQFPSYVFEGRFSLNQNAKCSLATNQVCYSFGLANIIYFKPSSNITSSSLAFNLRNMINSAFSLQYKNISIKIFSLIDGKIDSLGFASLIKLSKPSLNISGLITKSDSIYGGQSGINYYFDFKLGTYLPQNGKISITFPKVYTSLFTLNSKCNFTQSSLIKLGQSSNCQIVSDYQIIISPNGKLMDSSYTYQIVIFNITNPNKNISSQKFIIESFYSTDIYQKQLISRNTFSPPQINVLAIKSCQFDVTVESKNQYLKSIYSITLICPSLIKQASKLQIFLPWNLSSSTTKQICTSQTGSLYSYQCDINNQYINGKLTSFLKIYLREHAPQKFISIKGQITNGVKGSYNLQSMISYKQFTYLNGISNKIYLEQAVLYDLSKTKIQIQNYPFNRDYQSIYTFKIKNPQIKANSLRIQLPSSIKVGSGNIQCRVQNQNTTKDYFKLLTRENSTQLICSINGKSILIQSLQSILLSLKNDDFLSIDVFGLKNAQISVYNQQFKFTFMNITQGTGTILAKTSQLLSYKISPSPNSLQIDDISLESKTHQVLNKYTFNVSTITGSNLIINSKSQIGVRVLFPSEYLDIWSTIPLPESITLYLGNNFYNTTLISMVQGQLMARFYIPLQQIFNKINLQFIFRNPAQNINCQGSDPIFTINLFDFKQNSMLAQTIGNNIDCLEINDRLFWIKISGNSQIKAGNFSVYSIEIQKPAKYLKIKPTATSLAISFSPTQIIFNNYISTVKQFKIISYPGFKGQFQIIFIKQQINGSDPFYKDIKYQQISIIQPSNNYLIDFEQLSVKSIGQPIETFINIQVPSTVNFALIHTSNCSSSYTFIPQNRIIIPAGSTQVSYFIKYIGQVIPYMCVIKFQISSLTNINYGLKTNILYISGQTSIVKQNLLRPMILSISKQQKLSKDVGKTILTKKSISSNISLISKLKPVIYQVKQNITGSNSLQMKATVSDPGFIYYVVMQDGTQEGKITQKMIYDKNISTGIFYNKSRVQLNLIGDVNIQILFNISQLQSNKNYLLGTYLNCSIGISDIVFKRIKTGKSSNGAGIKISFNSMIINNTLLQALSTILRLEKTRMTILSIQQVFTNQTNTYQNQVMNSRRYIYQIALGPNRKDDSNKPIKIFQEFINSSDNLKQKLKILIPSLDLTYQMNCYQIIYSKPKIRGNGIVIEQLTNQNSKVSVQFWQSTLVYGVIIPYQKNGTNLLSSQISSGLNRQNVILNLTHQIKTQTDNHGLAQLNFKLLEAQKQYEIFITAQSTIPFEPRARLDDSQVLKIKLKTMNNLNLNNSKQKILERLYQQNNPELAEAVRQHILSVQQKKSLHDKVTRIRTRK